MANNRLWAARAKVGPFLIGLILVGLYMLLAQLFTHSVCLFESAVGLPCPGCGLTRAYICFFTGQFQQAFWWHPLFWYVPVFLGVWLFKWLKYGTKEPRWFTVFAVASAALFIGVYIVRMILRFPSVEPMVPNPDSFLQRAAALVVQLFHAVQGIFVRR